MDVRLISFGVIEIDGRRLEHDVVLERGAIRRRRKGPSKLYRDRYGHTPLSVDEAIPWTAPVLIVGTGADGRLPIMPSSWRRHAGAGWRSSPNRPRKPAGA